MNNVTMNEEGYEIIERRLIVFGDYWPWDLSVVINIFKEIANVTSKLSLIPFGR